MSSHRADYRLMNLIYSYTNISNPGRCCDRHGRSDIDPEAANGNSTNYTWGLESEWDNQQPC